MTRTVVTVVMTLGLSSASFAETLGSVDSRSAHEPGSVEETREHVHGPRHGGAFGDAEDLYHYEVLLGPHHQLILYVNDDLNRPLDVRTLQARWTLNPDDPAPPTGPFIPSPDGTSFSTILPPIETDQVHVEVAVLKDDRWVSMEFFLPVVSTSSLPSR